MAFGKAPEVKKIKMPITEAEIWTAHIIAEEEASKNWPTKWGWILDEYEELNKKLEEVSKNSSILKEIKERKEVQDNRTLKPFPETTNGEYGWISTKKEFNLEKYGPDVYKSPPPPEL